MKSGIDERAEAKELDGFDLDSFVPYLLNRITARMNKSLAEALKPVGVDPPQWRVLAVLHGKGPLSLSDLSAYTVIDQSTLSRTIDRMAAAGLVERVPRTDDARFIEAHLTGRGRATFAQVWPTALEQCEQALRGLDEAERRTLVRTLERILDNVRRGPAG